MTSFLVISLVLIFSVAFVMGAPPSMGTSCSDPIVIMSLPWSYTGSTTESGSNSAGTCGGTNSNDMVFSYTPSAAIAITMTTCSKWTGFDTVIYMRNGNCAAGTEMGCDDDACNSISGGGLYSILTSGTLTASTQYWIFVDGKVSTSVGNFQLTVYDTSVGPPSAQSPPPAPASLGFRFRIARSSAFILGFRKISLLDFNDASFMGQMRLFYSSNKFEVPTAAMTISSGTGGTFFTFASCCIKAAEGVLSWNKQIITPFSSTGTNEQNELCQTTYSTTINSLSVGPADTRRFITLPFPLMASADASVPGCTGTTLGMFVDQANALLPKVFVIVLAAFGVVLAQFF